MKIAIIVNPLIPVPPKQYGGIERIVFMLIQELKKNGHGVTLFANEDSVPGCKLVGYKEHYPYRLTDMIKINALTTSIAFDDFDLVHTFGRMSNIALLMRFKLPKIVSYQLPPTISQVKKAMKLAAKNTLHFTACSGFIAAKIAAEGLNVVAIHNGVDVDEYTFNPSVAADAPLMFLGRIQPEKGTHIAIDVALATGRDLIIAGNVPQEPHHVAYFEERIKPQIDGKRIRYVGPVDNIQKNEYLSVASALLMPITWDEPFGIVMAEALACGTPVIAFNRGAAPEVVIEAQTGFLCETEAEMSEAVYKIHTIDRRGCRYIAEQRFSAGVIGKKYQDLYQKLTGRE